MDKNKKSIPYYIDSNIPRSKVDQPNIHVKQRDYLSRLANLKSKYLGVKHRKEQWDYYTSKHFNKIDKKKYLNLDLSKYSELPKGSVVTTSIEHRDIRLENEFQSIIYSISSSLSALTYVITSFMQGSQSMHSHTQLVKYMTKKNESSPLSKLIIESGESWYTDLKTRRDTTTHYVSLLLKSTFKQRISDGENTVKTKNILGLMKNPEKMNFMLLDDIPLLEGSQFKHKSIEANGEITHKIQILDIKGNIVFESDKQDSNQIELIDGLVYVNDVYEQLESYIVKVLKDLNKRLI